MQQGRCGFTCVTIIMTHSYYLNLYIFHCTTHSLPMDSYRFTPGGNAVNSLLVKSNLAHSIFKLSI